MEVPHGKRFDNQQPKRRGRLGKWTVSYTHLDVYKRQLLYGVECKYYSARPDCVDFEIKDCPGIYALGDGAGFTRSLSQAAANGLIIGEILTKK